MRSLLTAVLILVGASAWPGPTEAEGPRPSAFEQAPEGRFEVTGQAGGGVLAVAAAGDRVYTGQGTRVVVMDASDPLRPVEIGRTEPLPGPVLDLAVQGTTVYAVAGGVVVIDAANATQPRVLGSLQSPVPDGVVGECCERLLVHQGFAYVWGPWWSDVKIVDVRSPGQPALVGRLGSDTVNDVALQGNLAVLADGCCWDAGPVAGLEVIDITDPTAPIVLADLDYADFAETVAFHGDTVLVSDAGCKLRRVELTQPDAPVAGVCMDAEVPLSPMRFIVAGDRLHLLGGQNDGYGYWIGDIGQDAVRWRLRYTARGAERMALGDDVAWFAGGVEGLQAAQVQELSDITSIGNVEVAGRPYRVTTAGDLAFVEAYGESALIVSLSDPAAPEVVASLNGTGPVAVDGSRLFVGSEGGIEVVDITDPANPALIATIPFADRPVALAVMDHYLVVTALLASPCCLESFVETWDIVDVSAARRLGRASGEWSARLSVLKDGYVYVAAVGGIQVVSVLEPALPRHVATYPVSATALAFGDNTLFAGRHYGEVHAFDVTDPVNAKELWVRSDFYLLSMAVQGDRLWVAHDREDGVRVLDVSEADGPFGVGLFQPESAFTSIAFAGQNAVVLEVSSDSQRPTPARLHVLDTSKPGKVAHLDLPAEPPRSAVAVARSGDYVLVADAMTGLVVLDARAPDRALGRLGLEYGATAVAASARSAYVSEPALDGNWSPGHSRLMRVDLGDPAAPAVASEVYIWAEVRELHLEGSTLLALGYSTVSGAGPSLQVLEVSASIAPRPAGVLDFESTWIASSALQGQRAYVATGNRLLMADLTVPDSPQWLPEYAIATEGVATALTVSGDLAFVGVGLNDEGVHILDVSDPLAVREAGRIDGPAWRVVGLAAHGDRLVVATDSGVVMWDVSDPANPVQVATMEAAAGPFNPSEMMRRVTTDGDMAWLAADAAGLVAARLPARDLPVRIALPLVMSR